MMGNTNTNPATTTAAKISAEKALTNLQSSFESVQATDLRYYDSASKKEDKIKTLMGQLYFVLGPVSPDAPNFSAQRLSWLLGKIEAGAEISPELVKKAQKVRSAPAAATFEHLAQLSALKVAQLDELGQALRKACPVLGYDVSEFHQQLPLGKYRITDPITAFSAVVEIVKSGPDIGANATKFKDGTYAVEIYKQYKVEALKK